MGNFGKFGRVAAVVCAASQLSGCVAAAIPLAALAMPAISGFVLYKAYKTVSGGSAEVSFTSKSPSPLSPVTRIAVWPGDEGSVRLAEQLASSGKTITSPSAVAGHLAAQGLSTSLQLMTEAERAAAYAAVCRRAQVELVFATMAGGVEVNRNLLSFSGPNHTYRANITAYSCGQQAIVWRDEMSVVVEGEGRQPANSEISQVAAQAWAERILEAMRGR